MAVWDFLKLLSQKEKYNDSPVILLDEATASLDAENETFVQEAISRLVQDKTVLIIAHRMRTVSGADKIVVIDNGKVCEEGRPDELLNRNGIYAKIVHIQNSGSDIREKMA